MRPTHSLLIFILAVLISTSCAQDKSIHEMNVAELKTAMKNDSSLIILDVRTPQELNGPLGKIDGVINIPIQELENRLNELSQYKSRPIAVICRSGNRSGFGTAILIKNGFNAKNVAGGMIEFRAAQ